MIMLCETARKLTIRYIGVCVRVELFTNISFCNTFESQ